MAAADRLEDLPELTSIQAYAGTAAPFNFNGLVRHYYLRNGPEQGDLQINLLPKAERSAREPRHRARHPHAAVRAGRAAGYGDQGRRGAARAAGAGDAAGRSLWSGRADPARGGGEAAPSLRARSISSSTSTIRPIRPQDRLRFAIDHESLEFYGVQEQAVYDTIAAMLGGVSVGYSHRGEGTKPDRDRHPIAAAGPVPSTSASWRRRCPRAAPAAGAPGGRTGRSGDAEAREGVLSHLPPRRARHRDGDGGAGRALRGADLRHAGGGDTMSPARTGGRAARRMFRYTASRSDEFEGQLPVGRRMGDHLCDLPRHGHGLRRGDRWASIS